MEDYGKEWGLLREVAKDLNQARDVLAGSITSIEEQLQELGIEVSCWYSKPRNRFLIGYAKLNGKWGLLLRDTNNETDPAKWETWRYSNAPTHLRIDATAWVGDLLAKLVTRSRETIANLKRATQRVDNLVVSSHLTNNR